MNTFPQNVRHWFRKAFSAQTYVAIPPMVERAKAEALALTVRHDVPVGPDVPADLKDERGRFFGTPNGFRISGRMLTDDLLMGSPPPTIPLLFALLPVLTLATVLLNFVAGPLGMLLGAAMLGTAVWTLNASVQRMWVVVGIAFGIAVPLLLGEGWIFRLLPETVLRAVFNPSSPLHSVAVRTFYVGVLGGLAGITMAVWFFARDRAAAGRFAAWSLGILVAFFVSVAVLPAFLKPVFWFGIGALPAVLYTRAQKRNRALRLAFQGQKATMESTGSLQLAHVKARAKQAARAREDFSGLVVLGKAKGVFTRLHDGYAPDEGLPFGLTLNDLAQHLIIFGASGTGKTGSVLRHLLRLLMGERVQSGLTKSIGTGLVLMDGKGSLGEELRGVPGYTLIEPAADVVVPLIAGLTPQEVAETLCELSTKKDNEGGSDTASHFKGHGHNFLVQAGLLLEAFVAADKARVQREMSEPDATDVKRSWHWTIKDLHRVSGLMTAAANKYTGSALANLIDEGLLHDYLDTTGPRHELLVAAVQYAKIDLGNIEERERSSIISTANGWMTPLLLDERILPWSRAEEGFDVTQVLRGAWIGLNLPELKYNRAGRLVQGLLKRRIFNALRDRADRDWMAAGESPVICVIDEAHELVTAADRMILPVARSLGGRMVYATQHFESFSVAFDSEPAAHRFLADFSSFVSFRANPKTYEWVNQRLGEVDAYVASEQGATVDYRFTAKLALSSPLLDPAHPMREQLRNLRLQGAGAVDERLLRARPQFSAKDARSRELHDHNERIDEMTLASLSIRPVTSGEWKKRPLLEPQDWSVYTAEDGVAVAEVMRAGCRRRDIVSCEYLGPLNTSRSA